jgi:hypothetical protein
MSGRPFEVTPGSVDDIPDFAKYWKFYWHTITEKYIHGIALRDPYGKSGFLYKSWDEKDKSISEELTPMMLFDELVSNGAILEVTEPDLIAKLLMIGI